MVGPDDSRLAKRYRGGRFESRTACGARADSFFNDNGWDVRLWRGWFWSDEAGRQGWGWQMFSPRVRVAKD